MIGVGSTAGRVVLGDLADRIGRRRSLIATFAGMALAQIVWAISTTFWSLAAFALVYGVFYGAFPRTTRSSRTASSATCA